MQSDTGRTTGSDTMKTTLSDHGVRHSQHSEVKTQKDHSAAPPTWLSRPLTQEQLQCPMYFLGSEPSFLLCSSKTLTLQQSPNITWSEEWKQKVNQKEPLGLHTFYPVQSHLKTSLSNIFLLLLYYYLLFKSLLLLLYVYVHAGQEVRGAPMQCQVCGGQRIMVKYVLSLQLRMGSVDQT